MLHRGILKLIFGVTLFIISCYPLYLAGEEVTNTDEEAAVTDGATTSADEGVDDTGEGAADNAKSPVLPDEVAPINEPTVANELNIARNDFLFVSLYADHRARHVGDIVTIIVVESSKATKSTATQTSKKSESSGSLSDFFGLGELPLSMGANAGSGYAGTGNTSRSDSMEAKISAIVKQVLPNGNLVLEGTRQVTVNDDVQTITVSGIVRPKDVGANNSILSIYLADAQIKYVGDGPMAQRPGIITRILQTPFHWVAGIFRRIF